ncbi:MAG: hypothetical protein ACXIVQ_09915 [Acidimicrobiales bacterium]
MPLDDVAFASAPPSTVEAAAGTDPGRLGPRGTDLARFGWASAALSAHPHLLHPWSATSDRAVRRALMRSPHLTAEAARRIVEVRRSGMHTLGSNPATPAELLEDNPGALRRRRAVDAVLPDGIAGLADHVDPEALVALGSPTVDLALACARTTDLDTAVGLAARTSPPADPWVLAVLLDRFGGPADEALGSHVARARRQATVALAAYAADPALLRS